MARRARLIVGAAVAVTTVGIALTLVLVRDSPDAASFASPPAVVANPAVDRLPWSAVRWQRVAPPLPVPAEPGLDRIDGLTRGGPGVVGWGRMAQLGRNQFNDMGAIYLSADGLGWAATPLDAGVGGPDASEIHLVTDGPAGILVIGGVCCTVEEVPALWRLADGRAWERLPWPKELDGVHVVDAIAREDRYLVAGLVEDEPVIWTSPDGLDWAAAGAGAGFGRGGIASLRILPDRVLAVGWREPRDTYDGAIWESRDGLDWSPLELGPLFAGDLDTTLAELVPFAGGWWMTGNEGPHADRVQCEQLLGHAASAARDPQVLAPRPRLSCGWGIETHWVSQDGKAWQRIKLPWAVPGREPAPGALVEFRLVDRGGPGLVALGEGYGDGRPSLFVSEDGRQWMRVRANEQFQASTAAQGMVVDGRLIVATTDGPALWVGLVE